MVDKKLAGLVWLESEGVAGVAGVAGMNLRLTFAQLEFCSLPAGGFHLLSLATLDIFIVNTSRTFDGLNQTKMIPSTLPSSQGISLPYIFTSDGL